MALRLTIMSQHARSLGDRATKEFDHGGGTIGRSLECSWPLPDGQRFLSSRHASIDYRSGSYYIIDTSTNGVFVNGSDQPVGRGKPQRLFSGDRIRIGDYELAVEIEGGEETTPLTEEHHVDPVDLAQRVEAPIATQVLVDEMEITGIGIEELLTEDEAATLTPPSNLDDLALELVEEPPRAETPRRETARDESPAGENPQDESLRIEHLHVENLRVESRADPSRAETIWAEASAPPRPMAPPRPPAPPSAAAGAIAKPAAERGGAPAAQSSAAPHARPGTAPPSLPGTGPHTQRGAGQNAKPGAASGAAPAKKPQRPARPPALAPVRGKPTDVLNPFFRGAGIPAARIDAQQAEAVLLRLGQVMREMIVGVTESLHLRAEQKNALRLPNTTIQHQNNNALKFSASVEETLTNLLFRDSPEYLTATEAVREAYADLRLHQLSLLKALRAALDVYAKRLDPDELEHKFSRGKSGGLMAAANKLKYWDLYKDVYQLVVDHPPDEFPAQFLDDFAEAYEEEIARAAPAESATKAQAG